MPCGMLIALAAVAGTPMTEASLGERVKALIVELGERIRPEDDTSRAIDARHELRKIGPAAVPLLVEAACGADAATAADAARLLTEFGPPALAPVKAKWPLLNDERRWVLMPVLEKHDPEQAREYAWNCLDSRGPIRLSAWGYHLARKDSRAKERYFQDLSAGEPNVRWHILPGKETVYDREREIALLIDLLKPDSWAAKGQGRDTLACIPPPGWPDARGEIVKTLGHRGAKEAGRAMIDLLAEKGKVKAYFGETVMPVLGDFGCVAAVPELKRILVAKPGDLFASLDRPERVHIVAARTLWQLGDVAGKPLLLEQLKSPRWNLRRTAAGAFARFGKREDIPAFALMLDDGW